MKLLFSLLFLSTAFISNAQSDADWENASADLCKGINKLSKKISTETKDAIIFSAETGTDLSEVFTDLATQNPNQLLKDADILEKMDPKLIALGDKLDKKYEGIFDSMDEFERNYRFMTMMDQQKGCDFAGALISIGFRNQNMNDEPPLAE